MGALCVCVPRHELVKARHRTKSGTSVRDILFMRTGSGKFETAVAQEEELSQFERMWRAADKDGSGQLSKQEIRLLLLKLNLPPITEKKFTAMFAVYDKDGSGELSREEAAGLFASLQSFPDVSDIFQTYSSNGQVMTLADVHRLMTEVGGDGEDAIRVERLQAMVVKAEAACQPLNAAADAAAAAATADAAAAAAVATVAAAAETNPFTLSCAGLARLLADPVDNGPMVAASVNTTYPLSHYFVNSSHNTYITGNQFSSAASAEAVRSALLRGVRVIELDVFDYGLSVVVSHKNSLVSTVLFEDCVRAIAESAFTVSEYPVILTLENHCGTEGQRRLVETLRRVLGPLLYDHDWEGDAYVTADEDGNGATAAERMGDDEGEGDEVEANTNATATAHEQGPDSWLSPFELRRKVVLRDKAKGRIPELLQLCYIKNYALKARADAKLGLVFPKRDCATSSSVEEGKLNNKLAVEGGALAFAEYCRDHLVRSYPAGMRVDSTNYSPEQYWAAGLQIVALNMQTNDDAVVLNRGRFRGSGGYVLKPPALLHPTNAQLVPAPQKLRLTIISGHHIPKPEYRSDSSEVIDPYVVVTVEGVSHQTPSITDNGFDPKWDCSFDFDVKRPDLALIMFKVMDSEMVGMILGKDDFCAAYACPVAQLRSGYRAIPLEYGSGRTAPHAYLFVRIHVLASSHKMFNRL